MLHEFSVTVLPCVSVSDAMTTGRRERLPLPKVCWDELTRDKLEPIHKCMVLVRNHKMLITLEASKPFPWWWR